MLLGLLASISVPSRAADPAVVSAPARGLAQVRIRPIRPSDLELERRFVCSLSPRSRYYRLLSGRSLLPRELERWTDVDTSREIALIALTGDGGDEEQIGVARCVVDPVAPGSREFAIVVADAWQRCGIGQALLCRLIDAAKVAGVTMLSGITLSENRGMLALGRKLGFRARREDGDATLTRLELSLLGDRQRCVS